MFFRIIAIVRAGVVCDNREDVVNLNFSVSVAEVHQKRFATFIGKISIHRQANPLVLLLIFPSVLIFI